MATPEQPSERKLRQNAGKSIVDGSLGIAPWNFEWSWRESADHVSSRARVMVIVVETVRLGDMQPLWMHPPTGLGFVSYSHPCKCLPKKSCHDSCNQVHQNFRTQPWSIARNCNRDAPQLFSERCSISTDFFSHVLRKDVYSMNRLEEKLLQRMEEITRTRHQWPHRQLEAKLWLLGSLLQPLSSQRSWKAVRHISSLSQLGLHDRFHKFHSEILWIDSVRSQNFLRPGIQTTKKWLDVKWLQLKVGDFRIPDLKNHHGNHPKKIR